MTPQQARAKLKFMPDNVREEISDLIDHLPVDQKCSIFLNWGKFIKIDWLVNPDLPEKEEKQLVSAVKNLSHEYECNFIYLIPTSPRMLILIPNQDVSEIVSTIKKRILVL